MKNNYKYILLLAVGFLWCSLSYLSQEIVLLNVYDKIITNNVIMIYDSFAMALGIIIFMYRTEPVLVKIIINMEIYYCFL